jgi:hypothetical protein
MFNMLNKQSDTGKNSPWLCKFLVTLDVSFHVFLGELHRPGHLLERTGLRNRTIELIGLRIAFTPLQPVRIPRLSGKGVTA